MRELFRRFRYLLNRRRFDRELESEMLFHREMAARAGHAGIRQCAAAPGRSAGRLGMDMDRPFWPGFAIRSPNHGSIARIHTHGTAGSGDRDRSERCRIQRI